MDSVFRTSVPERVRDKTWIVNIVDDGATAMDFDCGLSWTMIELPFFVVTWDTFLKRQFSRMITRFAS